MKDKEIIHINKEEEITSVVDRLTQTEEDEVDLIIPEKAHLVEDPISLRLLKREIDYLGKDVSLIFYSEKGIETAQELGFVVKKAKKSNVSPKTKTTTKKSSVVAPSETEKQDLISNLTKEFNQEKRSKPSFTLSKNSKIKADYASAQKMRDIINKEEQKKKKSKQYNTQASKEDVSSDYQNEEEYYDLDYEEEASQPKTKKPETENLMDYSLDQEDDTTDQELPPTESFKKETFSAKSRWLPKMLIGFLILIFVIVGIVVSFVLPKAEVVVFPETQEVNLDSTVNGSTDYSQVDASLNQLPLQKIEVTETQTQEFQATGEKDIVQRAEGQIVIYNEYSSAPQTLVATTRFKSPEGKVFKIPETITVPGAKIESGKIVPQSITVDVVAAEAGKEYNISPTKFTIPGFKEAGLMDKYNGFYAESKKSMEGGVEGKVKVVTEEDIEKAKSDLEQKAKQLAENKLKSQISEEFNILKDGFKTKVKSIDIQAESEEHKKVFTGEIEIIAKALIYRLDSLQQLVDHKFIDNIQSNQKILSETQSVKWQNVLIDWEEETIEADIIATEKAAEKINLQELKKGLAGKSEGDVRQYLSQYKGISKSKVSFWPFWVNDMPKQEERIEIGVD